MKIEGDPLNRAWVEFVHSDQESQLAFREVLLALHSSNANVKFGTAGTGFVIATTPEWLIFVTAKHVLEGILRIQRPWIRFDGGPFTNTQPRSNLAHRQALI